MKICIMDGSQSDDRMGARIKDLLTSIFSKRSDSVEYLFLRDLKIAPCAGNFSVGSKHRASAKIMMITLHW